MNIKDDVKIAGVGVSTVSRVINNHPDVKKETREKVMEIINEVKYIPNNSARILKKNNTKNIGVLLNGVYNPFFSEMLKIIGDKIEKAGFSMILHHSDYAGLKDSDALYSFIIEKRLCGAICLGGSFSKEDNEYFKNLEAPVVLMSVNCDMQNIKDNVSSVGIDNEKGAYEATEHLLQKGHKNIAIVLGKRDDLEISALRLKGYRKALQNYSIPFNDKYVVYGNYDMNNTLFKTQKLLKDENKITAIFAISDFMAIATAKAAFKNNLIVGKDIAIIGFDGMEVGKFYEPSISTIEQPRYKMASISVDLLFNLINGEKNKHIVMETKLIERESTKYKVNNI